MTTKFSLVVPPACLLGTLIAWSCAKGSQAQILAERIPEKSAAEFVASASLAWTDREIVTVAFNGGEDRSRMA